MAIFEDKINSYLMHLQSEYNRNGGNCFRNDKNSFRDIGYCRSFNLSNRIYLGIGLSVSESGFVD